MMTTYPWELTGNGSSVPNTLTDLRAKMPALEETTYLNWGASGPSPTHVVESVESALEYHEYEAPGSEGMYTAADDIFEAARDKMADYLGASPGEIALMNSTTAGVNRVGTALDWEPGDVVLTTDIEHAAGRLPWSRLTDASDITVRVLETERGHIDLDGLEAELSEADLFCVSAVDWLYGQVHPVQKMTELAHENDAMILVDAVQAVGQRSVDLDEWGADFVAGAGHKWLLGPWGGAFLYVAEDRHDQVEPIHVGYRSVSSATGGEYELYPDARRFELGTISPAPFAGLRTAIETIQSVGESTVSNRIDTLRASFVDAIPETRLLSPPQSESGLVTVSVDDPNTTVERLGESGITVRSLPLPNAVRVSIHATNTEAEVESAVSAFQTEWS